MKNILKNLTKNQLFLVVFLFAHMAMAELNSSIPSSISGLKTPNVHQLSPHVFRGQAPDISDLETLGISNVLIFKNEIKNEVQQEVQSLLAAGFQKSKITVIDFKWKNINRDQACEQTVQALQLLESADQTEEAKIYFHCTVGEDRTGYLAGLYDIAFKQWSLQKTFRSEMCARGYEAGEPNKPERVSLTVREELTPIFLQLSKLIQDNLKARLAWNFQLCEKFKKITLEKSETYQCSLLNK